VHIFMSLWLVPHPTVFVTHLWIHGMYVCIYLICVCVPMYACKHVCTLHECIYVCSHICTQTPMYLLLNVFMYVRTYAPRHLCIFFWMYLCMFACMHPDTYVSFLRHRPKTENWSLRHCSLLHSRQKLGLQTRTS